MVEFAAQVGQGLRIRGLGPEQAGDTLPGLRGFGVQDQECDQGDSARRPAADASGPVVSDCLLAQERHVQHIDPPTALVSRPARRCDGTRVEIVWRSPRLPVQQEARSAALVNLLPTQEFGHAFGGQVLMDQPHRPGFAYVTERESVSGLFHQRRAGRAWPISLENDTVAEQAERTLGTRSERTWCKWRTRRT